MNDAQLNECLKDSFNFMTSTIKDGVKGVNIPSIDPYIIPELIFENKFGGVNLKITLKNAKAVGASKTRITEVRSNIPVRFCEIYKLIHRLKVKFQLTNKFFFRNFESMPNSSSHCFN